MAATDVAIRPFACETVGHLVTNLKDLIRPPFANYDVVVYFGCGLFSLPLIDHYVFKPTGFRFPTYQLNIGIPLADIAVSTLSLLFSVYLLGHIISYASSLLTEKSIESFFGKVSSAIMISAISDSYEKKEIISSFIWRNFKEYFKKKNIKTSILRMLFLIPVIPVFIIINWIGDFDYYKSRISPESFEKIRRKGRNLGLVNISLYSHWYKDIEHYVINRYPVALNRMYNYLVISGIFRSLSIIFLASIWMEAYFLIHYAFTGHYHITILSSDKTFGIERLFSIITLYVIYAFSVSSYMKFQRRYAEEALFAFLLTDWPDWIDSKLPRSGVARYQSASLGTTSDDASR